MQGWRLWWQPKNDEKLHIVQNLTWQARSAKGGWGTNADRGSMGKRSGHVHHMKGLAKNKLP